MDYQDVNPVLLSAGRFEWYFKNEELSVSYNMRVFTIHAGEAVVEFTDRVKQPLHAGTAVLIAPGQPYRFSRANESEPFTLYCITYDTAPVNVVEQPYIPPCRLSLFHPEFLSGANRDSLGLPFPLVLEHAEEIDGLIVRIYEERERRDPFAAEICSGMIKTALFRAIRMCEQPKPISAAEEKAAATMRYIERHYRYPINETEVAAAMSYHPYYLARLMKKYYGVTPYRYLIGCRVREAERLLEHTNLSVAEIAEYCGYTEPTLFSAVFRRETGMAPSVYRKAKRGEEND